MKRYRRIPIIAKILVGAGVGALTGAILGKDAAALQAFSDIALQILLLVATPLIFFGIVHALSTTEVRGHTAAKMAWVLMSNTVVAAIIVAQALGIHLSLGHQGVLLVMAVLASIGAAGVPHAGLVTLLATFRVLHLPLEYVPLIVPVDWILDRCRTTMSVAGVLISVCIVDGGSDAHGEEAKES